MPTERQGGRLHYAWVIAGVTFLALLAASGVRSSFGVFIKPLERDFGWERGAIALAASRGADKNPHRFTFVEVVRGWVPRIRYPETKHERQPCK